VSEGSIDATRNVESDVRGETRFDQQRRLGRDVGEDNKEKQIDGKNKQRSNSKAKKKTVYFCCGKTGHFKRDYTNKNRTVRRILRDLLSLQTWFKMIVLKVEIQIRSK
ncbi:hypothetical protein V2J09_000133, partial [Rumex salicifolius]